METVRVTARLPKDDVEFLDEQVQEIGPNKTDRTEQLHVCIVQRRITLLPKWKREQLYKKLGVEVGAATDKTANKEKRIT